LALAILKIKITRKCRPLIASWSITYRCNKKCKYCVVHKRKERELGTKQCLRLINILKKKGTRILTITGGEPTLRRDLPIILRYAKSKGLSLFLNTNGTGFNKELALLVDRVSLSLDGPESTNDYVRGKGAYRKVVIKFQFL
jgi:MoaA/NifB/PqqE/SkfB family radical SAM enzyme